MAHFTCTLVHVKHTRKVLVFACECSVEPLQAHPFFAIRRTNWDAVFEKRLTPPFRPHIQNEEDVSQFDTRFTQEPAIDSPTADNSFLSKSATNLFDVRTRFCSLRAVATRSVLHAYIHLSVHINVHQNTLVCCYRIAQGFSYIAPTVLNEIASRPWIEHRAASVRTQKCAIKLIALLACVEISYR